jgi:drug/metabolite transporter (DMT)-like permease
VKDVARGVGVRVWAALIVVYVVWGSTYLAIRYAVGADTGAVGLPPLLMAGSRFVLAGLLMLPFALRSRPPDGGADPIGWPQWRATAVVGVLLLLGGNGLVTLGEERGLPSGIAAVLVATVPLWLTLLTLLRRREAPSRQGGVGLGLGFGGVVLLVGGTGEGSGDGLAVGMLLVAPFLWSIGSYWSQGAPLPRRPLLTTSMEMICGGLAQLVVGVAIGELDELDLGAVGASAWWGYVYLIVFGSMLAFTAYAWLLSAAPLSLVGTYAFVNPAVAVALGALPPLREPLTARTLAATAVIVVGVALIVTVRRAAVPRGEPATGPVLDESVRA